MRKYELLKDLPNLSKGAIFELRPYDDKHPDRGNPGRGCLILAWINGDCQFTQDGAWCGETYVFPGQLADNEQWFRQIKDPKRNEQDFLRSILSQISDFINNR